MVSWKTSASATLSAVAAGCVPISSNLRMSSWQLRRGRRQRPQILDQRPAHVEEAGADRRQQPLVQAGAVVVALEIAQREREVAVGVRAVDDGADAAGAGHPADRLDREDLPGQVGDVADVDHLRARRDGGFEAPRQIVQGRRRDGERDLLQHDPVALHPLLPGVEHAAVVLVGREDFVAGREVDPELRDLQRLAGVAGDRELLGIAAGAGGELAPDRFPVRLEHLPHVVHRRLVRDVQVALVGLVDDARARRDAAVVQVDDAAIEREPELDLAPERLVAGDVLGIAIAGAIDRGPGPRHRVVGEDGRYGQSDPSRLPQEPPPGRSIGAHGSEV